jgi:hypothetical protein
LKTVERSLGSGIVTLGFPIRVEWETLNGSGSKTVRHWARTLRATAAESDEAGGSDFPSAGGAASELDRATVISSAITAIHQQGGRRSGGMV